MFHLLIYTQEHPSHVNSLLTLFENVYDRHGNKISKHTEQNPEGEKKDDTNDNKDILNKVSDERVPIKQKLPQDGGGGPKVQHYTSSFLQLYINDQKNFDLYLIEDDEEDDEGGGGETPVAASGKTVETPSDVPTQKKENCAAENEDIGRNQTSTKKGGDKRERGSSVKRPKEAMNQKDTLPHDDDKGRRVNLPLHRSHMLFILSLPTHVPFDHLYHLINAYTDFIEHIKVFHLHGNMSFLHEEEECPTGGGEDKVVSHEEESRPSSCPNRMNEAKRRVGTAEDPPIGESSQGREADECSGCNEQNQRGECASTFEVEREAMYQSMLSVVKRRLKKKKKIKSYSVLICFKTQIYADMFYSEYQCTSLNHLVEGRQGEWRDLVDTAGGEKDYPDWYIYCAFVSLVYYIVDGEVDGQVDEPLLRSEGENATQQERNGSSETHTHGRTHDVPPSNNNPFDINHFKTFHKSIITDGNTCTSFCPLCMDLLCEEVCFTLTRNKNWHARKRGKASKLCEYVNLSCNVCSLIFLYDSVSRLAGGQGVIDTPMETPHDVAHSVEDGIDPPTEQNGTSDELVSPARDAPSRLGHILGTLKCRDCNNVDDIWLCLTCANIGCGRYQKSHAKFHSTLYNHHYCLNLRTKQVWNYMREAFIEERVEDDQSELALAWRGGSGPTGGGFGCNTFHACVDEPPAGRGDFLYDDACDAYDMHGVHDAYDAYDSNIYNKIYDIFTDDAYISDGLKNELLYSLYSLLSHESNVYNSSLVELQCSYMNRLDMENKSIKSIRDTASQIKNQNRKMETFLQRVESSIKVKNNERAQLQQKINFLRDLNKNMLSQRCAKMRAGRAAKQTTQGGAMHDNDGDGDDGDDDDDNDSRKIKRLDETIRALQQQVDDLMRAL
ncbi:hypothetical protein AK88_02467 [Plasmodium fragile]|uniref:UBP-type domain-containing protein n=1 Tax=Plasmodium fragile TaxID=5857 RepID=A0A0D9QLN4_PLAFR|nr:uncharacterized protein AK88_02467 [Plasmodium fragile]KJP87863.1 hypothetical protein AK88_02467 [Plasmodium fragile]